MKIVGHSSTKPTGVIPFDLCPAKSCTDGSEGTRVFDHCRYAGMVAEALREMLPEQARSVLPETSAYLVSLHDIGKVSPGFQGKYFSGLLEKYSPEWLKHWDGCNIDHASVGAAAYMKIAGVEQSNPVVVAIAVHHGSARDVLLPNVDGPDWQRERVRLVDALAKTFGVYAGQVDVREMDYRILSGLMCVADWIASNETYFPPDNSPILQDCLPGHVRKTLSEIGFSRTMCRAGLSFGDVFQSAGRRFEPRSEQQALMDVAAKPGVYIMEATMGAGKTEAALYSAYALLASGQNAGIYFALPTRLTSDRIYLRMQDFLDRTLEHAASARLSHGRAWLEGYQIGGSGKDGCDLPSWFSPSKRGLLYPFAVGTIDQALLAAMNVRHSFVRLFGLAGKVVVLDEVHSYDMYTGSLVAALVRDLRKVGCTVIILSATLTRAKRDELLGCATPKDAAYPLVTGNADGKLLMAIPRTNVSEKRIAIRRIANTTSVIEAALQEARKGCNVLCVANTVCQAQNWYWALKAAMSEVDAEGIRVGLLHSRFPDFRRSAIEDEWMGVLGKDDAKRPQGSILISTQIVEQSVDIDADYLITELAPIDMLFQRMGRLWRHTRTKRPVDEPICAIAFDGECPSISDCTEESFRRGIGEGSCWVYAPYVLLQTLRVLDGRDVLSIPNDMRSMIEAVYAECGEIADSVAASFKIELEEMKREMQFAAIAAEAHVTSLPPFDDSEDTPPTRYGSRKTLFLLLVKSVDAGVDHGKAMIELLDGTLVTVDAICPDFAVTKSLYANVVAVPVNKTLGKLSREYENRLLARHFHVGEMPFLCRVENDGRLTLVASGENAGLAYRNEMGVFDASRLSPNIASNATDDNQPFEIGEADW